MRVLVTGAFGTVGQVTLREALARGHQVTALVRGSRRNRRIARRLVRGLDGGSIKPDALQIRWGDVRSRDDLESAVEDQDAVIHLAAVLPPQSEDHPSRCDAINVGGTRNLIGVLEARASERSDTPGSTSSAGPPSLVYVSSVSVMGPTQHREPPLTVEEPSQPNDIYSASKSASEALVGESSLSWSILRLSAVMPTRGAYRLSMTKLVFDMALDARCEVVMDVDVGYALVRAAEDLCNGGPMRGRTVFIAGGRDKGCQLSIEEMLVRNLAPVGLRLPRRHLFPTDLDSYYLDWYDTEEGQRILGYQRHSAEDWRRISFRRLRLLRLALRPVRPLAGLYLDWVGWREARNRDRRRAMRDSSAESTAESLV